MISLHWAAGHQSPSLNEPSAAHAFLNPTLKEQQKMTNMCRVAIFLYILTIKSISLAQTPVDFHWRWQPGDIDRVTQTVEVEGTLRIQEGNQITTPATKVAGKFVYFERRLSPANSSRGDLPSELGGSVRYYQDAETDIRVDGSPFRPALRENRRLVRVKDHQGEVIAYSLQGPLTRDELDLLTSPGNSLVVDGLLPPRPVRPGDTWEIPATVLCGLLSLEAVSSSTVRARFLEVTHGVARVEWEGKLEGAANAMSTQLQIRGRYQFDLRRGRIIWVGFAFREDRPPGPIAPGVDVVAKVALTIEPGAQCPELTQAEIEPLLTQPEEALLHLEQFSPDHSWQLEYERTWYLTALTEQNAVFRLVDRGLYLAQCKIAVVGSRPRPLTLPDFQEDIRHSLGKQFSQFVQAAEGRTAAGTPFFRVVARGSISDVPICWVYYWLEGASDRNLVVGFTFEDALLERVEEAERKLLAGLKLRTEQVAGAPTPAKFE